MSALAFKEQFRPIAPDEEQSPTVAIATVLPALAQEIAYNLVPRAEIAARYGLSLEQLELALGDGPQSNAHLKALVAEQEAEWHAPGASKQRIRTKARTGLELQLPGFIAMLGDPNLAAADRLNAWRIAIKVADMEPAPAASASAGSGGAGFHLTLNLGGAEGAQELVVGAGTGADTGTDSPAREPPYIEHAPSQPAGLSSLSFELPDSEQLAGSDFEDDA